MTDPARDAHGDPRSDPHGDPRGRGWLRRLTRVLLQDRRDVIAAVLAAAIGSSLQAVVPLLSRQIVDNVIIARSEALWPWLVALIAVSAVVFALAYVRRYRGGRLAYAVQTDLRNAVHDHLQTLDEATLRGIPTGQLVSRANSDSTLVQGLLMFLPLVAGNLLMALASLVIMFVLSPVLAVIGLLVIPLVFAVSYRMRVRIFPASWDGQQREGDVAQIVDEDVTGVRVVKAFGQERRELGRLAAQAQRLYGSQLRVVRLQARYQPLLEAIPSLAQVAVLAVGGWFALRGQISLGTFLAFSTYVAQFVAPARQLAGVLTVGQQARAGVERIFGLLDVEPTIQDLPGARDVTSGPGDVRLSDVRFRYDAAGPEVLRGLDLHVAPGERVALIGPSGSGKSTVATLLSRFADPTSGTAALDGVELRELTLHSVRSRVATAFDESFLFSDSIRANIAYGRPDATPDQVEAAARTAHADGFVRELPDGYDTVVGERGLTLSGGQRQRIALARAVLADPEVLVLDDATSAVDTRTEEAIHAGLRDVLAGRTTVLIAQRASTLELADRVVVLDGGRVVDQAGRDELPALAERNDFYRTLLTGAASSDLTDGEAEDSLAPSRPDAAAGLTLIGPPGSGGANQWSLGLSATPELEAAVAALPPIRDEARIDLPVETRADPRFSLGRLLRGFRNPLLLGLLLVVLDALAGIAGPVLVQTGVDDGVAKGSLAVLFAASGVYLVVVLADLVDQVAAAFVTGRMAQRIMLSLRLRIWAQLQRLSLDYYEREMAGRIMTRMTTDVDQFESLVENGVLSALVALVTFVGVGVALVVVNPELGLITLSVVVPLAVATVIFRRRSSVLYDVARDRIAVVNAAFQESLSGVRESQAFTHESRTVSHFHELGASYLAVRVSAQRLVATYFPFVQFLSSVADAIVLGVGSALIADGRLTTGELIAFLLYITLFFSPIQQLSQVFDAWQQTRVSVNRIGELMRQRTDTPEAEPAVIPERLRGAVALEGVRFGYVPDTLALKGIDLVVAPGETVALVGETGAGKSTVLKLLARFYDPQHGAVTIDGMDLRSLDLEAFRQQLGYVPQEAFLFTGSVRDNIAYGRPDATAAQVEAAARAVGAHELIETLPGGYAHELSERGTSLSSGQRQLIALARAQLVDPAVLLLDEATSNLDLATEARVSAAMHRVADDRTTIVIAHRLQTARTADRIVVFDHGRIVEQGTHDELLDAGGTYAGMWQAYEPAVA